MSVFPDVNALYFQLAGVKEALFHVGKFKVRGVSAVSVKICVFEGEREGMR